MARIAQPLHRTALRGGGLARRRSGSKWKELRSLFVILLPLLGGSDAGANAEVSAVRTAVELEVAVRAGAQHIVILEHLDATAIAIPAVLPSTMSMRGMCIGRTPPPDVQGELAERCVVSVNSTFLQMSSPESRLLLLSLHIRMQPASPAHDSSKPAAPVSLFSVRAGDLWAQDVHLQGPGVDNGVLARAVNVASAGALQLNGAAISGFEAPYGAGVLVESPAHAGIQACAFENTSADYGPAVALDTAVNKETFVWLASVSAPPATNEDVNGSARGTAIAMYQKPATIWADDPAAHPEEAAQAGHQPVVLLPLPGELAEGPAKKNDQKAPIIGAAIAAALMSLLIAAILLGCFVLRRRCNGRPVATSSELKPCHNLPESRAVATEKESSSAAATSDTATPPSAAHKKHLNDQPSPLPSRSIAGTKQPSDSLSRRSHDGQTSTPAVSTGNSGTGGGRGGSSGGTGSSRVGSHVGSAGGSGSGCHPLNTLPSASLRSSQQASLGSSQQNRSSFPDSLSAVSSVAPLQGLAAFPLAVTDPGRDTTSSHIGSGLVTSQYGSTLRGRSAAIDSTSMLATGGTGPVAIVSQRQGNAGATMDSTHLEAALDDFALPDAPLFLDRFRILSHIHRRVGGQGLVQFAEAEDTREEFAIKFFTNRLAFEREQALYSREELRDMMPAVRAVVSNSDSHLMSPSGHLFPPFIIVERGESLNEWALRIAPDFPTILTVLCHVAARLHHLHQAGLAHRDLKPANILWRPRHHSWTLIDFGCAAEIGVVTTLSLSLKYAAPEAVKALQDSQRTIVSDPAVDMWALGVIAYELLMGKAVFPRGMNASDISACLAGSAPLPWETRQLRQRRLPELRFLRRSVMSCLQRDPLNRPTSQQLLQTWNNLFDSHSREQ